MVSDSERFRVGQTPRLTGRVECENGRAIHVQVTAVGGIPDDGPGDMVESAIAQVGARRPVIGAAAGYTKLAKKFAIEQL